jgi:hypothetical protein
MSDVKIDFSRYRRGADNDEVERAQKPQQQLRPQTEIERHPTFFQKKQEQEGFSWSGAVFGGRQDRSR